MKRYILILHFFVFSLYSQDTLKYERLQQYQVLDLAYTYYTPTKFEDEEEYPEKIRLSQLDATFQFPIKLSKNNVINNLLEFRSLHPATKINIPEYGMDRSFYSLAYELGYIKQFGTKNKSLIALLKPTLATDYKSLTISNDFLIQGTLMLSQRKSEYMKYGFGITFNTKFGSNVLLPIFQYVRKKGKWETDLLLPSHAYQYYYFGKSKIGISLSILGNSFNYTSTLLQNIEFDKLSYTKLNLGITYNYSTSKGFGINVITGSSIFNSLKFLDQNGDTSLDLTPVQDYFIRISFVLEK